MYIVCMLCKTAARPISRFAQACEVPAPGWQRHLAEPGHKWSNASKYFPQLGWAGLGWAEVGWAGLRWIQNKSAQVICIQLCSANMRGGNSCKDAQHNTQPQSQSTLLHRYTKHLTIVHRKDYQILNSKYSPLVVSLWLWFRPGLIICYHSSWEL